jgi:5'-nucleotidase
MKIVITNDDGIDEPGIGVLAELCEHFGLGEVTVVAPSGPRSAISHQVTEGGAIHVEEQRPRWFAVDGTPADCTRLAVRELCPDVDWLLAGINAGANLGVDVYVSGTIAAAREATIHGVRALALSQHFRRYGQIDWPGARQRAALVLREVLGRETAAGEYWSANLPDPLPDRPADEIVDCPLDASPGAVGYDRIGPGFHWRADYHDRPRRPDHDVDVCFGGRIALTRLRLGG